jgi:amidohydrolase
MWARQASSPSTGTAPGPWCWCAPSWTRCRLEEKTGLPYASHAKAIYKGHETFVAHSCGHDIHMAAWVGTAKAMVAMKDKWHGTLMFIGQPAEEVIGGASAMLADHLFERFGKPDIGFALHSGANAYGEVEYKAGVLTSNADTIHIQFRGRGGHGSMPSITIDPVLEAARFVVDMQSVVSREKDPAQFGVVTIGSLQAGSAGNIIPDHADLYGTMRSYDTEVRNHMMDGVKRTVKAVADMAGAPEPLFEITESGKAVVNDAALTERTAPVFQAAFGVKAIRLTAPMAPSEDYSEFIIAGVPSLFFDIGALDPKTLAEARAAGKPVAANHSPYFAPVPEPTIRTGVEAMSLALMNVMSN